MDFQNEIPSSSPKKHHLNGFSSEGNSNSSSIQEIVCEEHSTDLTNSSNEDGESEVLTLLELCRNIHQQRLTEIDNNDNLDLNRKNEEKISVLQSYLQQVEEQNDVLASTMIELEKEAQKRVKQMEKRLKSSAKTTMEAVINIHECEKEMRRLVEERISMETVVDNMQQHLSSLKVESSFLRDQNCNLNHDVQALLHVIHHARSTGHWEMNCVTFCEVTPEQIFGPVQSISHLYPNESPLSDFHMTEENKEMNSDFSSQDVSNSSQSTPSISHQLESSTEDPGTRLCYTPTYVRNEIMERDKRIALLESQISELQHQLNIKEVECECHMWKLESLMQYNQNRAHTCPSVSLTTDTSVQKCNSLPDIGNIYSYTKLLRRSHSCRTSGYQANLPARPIKKHLSHRKNECNKKSCHINVDKKTESRLCKFSNTKHDHVLGIQKAQSEPYLFMFGDNVYVYRPCEPIKKASNVALCNDYQLSLPPCQSIDLKFPVDESNLKICDWDLVRKNDISYGIPDSPYHKVDESSSSCCSNDSLNEGNSENILCNGNTCRHMHQNMCEAEPICRNCCHETIYSSQDTPKKCSFNSDTFPKLVSLAVQTDDKISYQSIGLQADITEDQEIDLMNGNLFEFDLSQLRRTVKSLQDCVLKAEDKAEAKTILIEQLQGHITSAVKEVEMKDKALSNVEKKLELSRNECSNLKENISSLNSEIQQKLKDIEDLQMLNHKLQLNVKAKEEKITEMTEDQKMLQDQKRALMTQLDAQDDLYEEARQDLVTFRSKTEEYILQIELQNQTIQNLQEALVKSKRTSDSAFSKNPSSSIINSNLINDGTHSSRGSIVDI